MALVTLAEVKAYLGISANTYDTFLTEQINFVSAVIEGYCGRVFNQATYTQDFYSQDYEFDQTELHLFHYPLVSITSIKPFNLVNNAKVYLDPVTEYRINKPMAIVMSQSGLFSYCDGVEIIYSAGYATIPDILKNTCYGVIEGRYSKKVSGVNLNFGSDVQSISIPGTISIAFDYSLTSNERANAFGVVLGNYLNIVDKYRSHRAIVGEGKVTFVS